MKAKIKIGVANGTGWTKEQPAPFELEFVLDIDELVRLEDHGARGGSIVIDEINDKWVKVRTNGLRSPESKGEVLDLKENKMGLVHTIMLGRSLTFSTIGTDQGSTCKLFFLGTAD